MSVFGVLPIAPQTPMIRPSNSQRPVILQRFSNWILSTGVIAALLGAPSAPQASETVNAALPVQLAQAIQSPAVSTPTTSTAPASVSGAAPLAQAATSGPISPNTIAQVLAGVTPPAGHPVVDRLVATPEWKEHREWAQSRWLEVNRRLDAMRTWRDAELRIPDAAQRTLLYPFSGPDFLNADALFPTHPKLVFFSLERAGTLPDIAKLDHAQFARMLGDVRHALSDIFERNYFITSYMTTQLTKPQLRGTVPVIALMMALTGQRILSIEPIDPFPALTAQYNAPPAPRPDPKAREASSAAGDASGATDAPSGANTVKAEAPARAVGRPRVPLSGARIVFAKPGGPNRTLDYYGLDATDKELRWYPQFLEMALGGGQPSTALIKSASYLLHDQQFAGTRSAIMKAADIIVQDDTGVPLRFLKSAGYTVDLYGMYMIPIKPMTYATQPDLEVAYREAGSKVKPIDFPFGYHGKSGKSGLILARRKP